MRALTQKRLKELLHYSPGTGLFTRLVTRGNSKAGKKAGSKHSAGYLSIRIGSKAYFCHRLAHLYMSGKFPSGQVDHEDHNRSNNKWKNIQTSVTHRGNSINISLRYDNKSGFNGVWFDKKNNKWKADIFVHGKKICLGTHVKKSDAIAARKVANKEHGFHINHGSKK